MIGIYFKAMIVRLILIGAYDMIMVLITHNGSLIAMCVAVLSSKT